MNDSFLDTKFYLENWKENAFKAFDEKNGNFLEYLLVVILIFCLIISTE